MVIPNRAILESLYHASMTICFWSVGSHRRGSGCFFMLAFSRAFFACRDHFICSTRGVPGGRRILQMISACVKGAVFDASALGLVARRCSGDLVDFRQQTLANLFISFILLQVPLLLFGMSHPCANCNSNRRTSSASKDHRNHILNETCLSRKGLFLSKQVLSTCIKPLNVYMLCERMRDQGGHCQTAMQVDMKK